MPDKVPKTQAEIEADEIIRERVIKNAGINRPEVLNYAVRLTKTIVGAPGQLTLAVFAVNTAATLLPALSGVAVSNTFLPIEFSNCEIRSRSHQPQR